MGKRARLSSENSATRIMRSNLRRLLIRGLASGISAAYSLALDFQSLLRRKSARRTSFNLPSLDLDQFGSRPLVIAPHPDDETLGCGGVIRALVERGAQVRVVFLTNGDGYWAAAGSEARGLRWGPESYLDLGRRREKEARAAARQLGLPDDSLVFYGFPDRGLAPLWTSFFDTPFQSPYTRADTPPYPSSVLRGSSYTGSALLKGLSSTIEACKPTAVLAPHPLDDHPDHSAAYAFTTAALYEQGLECRIFTYLVHRGHWPYPGRRARNSPLEPPKALLSVGTRWATYPLTERLKLAKREGLACYPSQTSLMKDFLHSFVRSNELFGQVWTVTAASAGLDAAPQFVQPTRDTLTRRLNRGADISRLWVGVDSGTLFVRVETAGKLERGNTVRIHLRSFAGGLPRTTSMLYGRNGAKGQSGSEHQLNGRFLEARLPLESLGNPDVLWIGVKTSRYKLSVDTVGWQPVRIFSGHEAKPEPYNPDK